MKISWALIIYRANSSIAFNSSIYCENVLKEKKVKSNRLKSDFNCEQISKYLCNPELLPDLVIVLGGDGTVLKCANALVDYDIPLLCFNIGGNLGFLTQEKDFLFDKSFIEILEKGDYIIDSRRQLKCVVYNDEKNSNKFILKSFDALNDFYFKSVEEDISPTNQIQIEINAEKVNAYKGDGLIIASSTGSTAYSLSAGGPVITPDCPVVQLTPIAPHSLASRALVFNDSEPVTVFPATPERLVMVVDGNAGCYVWPEDRVLIRKSKHSVKFIRLEDHEFFQVLRNKLGWGLPHVAKPNK